MSFKKIECTLLVLALCLTMPLACLAQGIPSDARPRDFYSQGFVSGQSGLARVTPSEPRVLGQRPDKSASAIPSPGVGSSPNRINAESPTPSPAANKLFQVKAISAVISAVDPEHLKAKLTELQDLSAKHDLSIDHLYLRGDFQTAMSMDKTLNQLLARGAEINFANVPDRYQATRSPTWVVETPQGEIILEATGPLAENFGDKGEFILQPRELRPNIEEQPLPTVEPVDLEESAVATSQPSPSLTPTPSRQPASVDNQNDGIEQF